MSAPENKFEDSIRKGQIGEQVIIEALRKITEVKDLTDYTKYKSFQQKGLDFEFRNRHTGEFDRADAKANISKTDLHFVELYKGSGDYGWLYKTKSDWIFCYSHYTKRIYFYDVVKMKKHIEERLEKKNIKISHLSDGCSGVWLPVNTNPLIKELK